MIDSILDWFRNLAMDVTFLLTLLAVFGCVSLVAWVLLQQFEKFLKEYQAVFKETATGNLNDMFLFVDPQRLFIANVLALIFVPLLGLMLTGDFIIASVLFVIVLVIPWRIYKHMRQQRLSMFEKQLPDALVMISGSLSSGASLTMALESVIQEQPAPLSQEFMLVIREQRIGVEFEHSLKNMERRLPLQDLLMFTSAMRISREVGGDLGEVLNTLAETLRRKASMEGKIKALTAQGKMQGLVMTGLPLLLGVLLMFMEPEAMGQMFTTPYGWGLIVAIVILEALGYMFIKKVTTIDV